MDEAVRAPLSGDLQSTNAFTSLGIASLPPGRRMEYSLAVVHEAVSEAVTQQIVYRVTVTGSGPFGEIPVLSYGVDLADLGPTRAVGEGSLRLVSKSIDELAKALKK